MDVNDIKAGKYQLLAERWDETTSKPGEPWTFRRHGRGDIVQLSEEEARRLVQAGAVVKPGELEKAAAAALYAQYQAVLAQIPDDVRAQMDAEQQEAVDAAAQQAAEAAAAEQAAAQAAASKPSSRTSAKSAGSEA